MMWTVVAPSFLGIMCMLIKHVVVASPVFHAAFCSSKSVPPLSPLSSFMPIMSGDVHTNAQGEGHGGNICHFAKVMLETDNEPSTKDDHKIRINPVVSKVKISKTVEVFSLVKEMEAAGESVTSLCVGEPDFPPPKLVLDAAVDALRDGKTTYTAVTGTAELRQAIVEDLKRRKGLTYNPKTDVVIGNGAKQSVYQAMMATAGTGDDVIIPAPYWPSYPEMATLVGANPVILNTNKEDGYLVTPQALKETLKRHPNARLIVLCNPSNPTGGVHNRERLEQLANVLQEYPDVAILADEIYERLVYIDDSEGKDDSNERARDDHRHVSFASISGMFHRTITINGFSKAYAMTGMRLGYLAAPTHIAKACASIQSQLTSCAGSVSQVAGVAALTEVSESEMENNLSIMRQKRDYVLNELQSIEGVVVDVPPRGAFYVLPDVSSFCGDNDTEMCIDLLKQKKLALVPGSSFGAPGTVRISYATGMDELRLAMSKLKDFFEEYRSG